MSEISHFNWEYAVFNYPGIDRMSDSMIGVYVIWRSSPKRCIYVGKAESQPIRNRLLNHWGGSHNELLKCWLKAGKNRDGIKVCYRETEVSRIDRLEKKLIQMWHPEANITHNPNRREREKANV